MKLVKKLLALSMLVGCLGMFGFSGSAKAKSGDWWCEQQCLANLTTCNSFCGSNRSCYRNCARDYNFCMLSCGN
jgi:hypothetical protein